jgi:hypothetical protein
MHQRKAIDTDNDRGRIAASGGATIAYGHPYNRSSSNNNNNNNNGVATANHSSASIDTTPIAGNKRKQRIRRRRKHINRAAAFDFAVPALLLTAMVLFGILWIRMLWKIGSNSSSNSKATTTIPGASSSLFQLESEEAPRCNSNDPGSPSDIDTTLVTQLSDDRLWMMEHHCERYGPKAMSIAVYSNHTLEEIVTELKGMGCRVNGDENDNGNGNDYDNEGALVSVKVLDAHTHGAWNKYPVNDLRNLALKGVKTTHITYIDVDFWPSEDLYEAILSLPIQQRLFDDPKLALVIPAFQLHRKSDCRDETQDCREEHVPLMPKTTNELKQMVVDRTVEVFDPTNRGGHGSTNYGHWFENQVHLPNNSDEAGEKSSSGSSGLYEIPCLKSHRYEPFVTIRYCRELTPPFQRTFSGYGKNKMTWMMQVVASGFVFSQVSGAYLVHYPHAISKSRQDWNKAPKELVQSSNGGDSSSGNQNNDNSNSNSNNYSVRKPKKSDGDLGFENYHRGKVDDLYIRFKEWLAEAIPEDKARLAMCDSAQDDDTKLWIDPNRKHWKTKQL